MYPITDFYATFMLLSATCNSKGDTVGNVSGGITTNATKNVTNS